MNLQQENKALREKLTHAQEWMQHEVEQSHSHMREIVSEKLQTFFPAEVLSQFPEYGVEHIISAEIFFAQMHETHDIDGTPVIIEYQKLLDSMIDLYIIKGFRHYTHRHLPQDTHATSPLDRALKSVFHDHYHLSVGRLFQALSESPKQKNGYHAVFLDWIESRPSLQKSLRESNFLVHLGTLIDLDILGEKRHSGILSYAEAQKARKSYIGDLHSPDCLIGILAHSLVTPI